MAARPISKADVGTDRYNVLLREEAAFWDGARAEDMSTVAASCDPALAAITSGDLHDRALELVAARGRRVLELGCGAGALSIALARRGCVVDGVDIAPGRVRQGQDRIDRLRRAEGWSGDARLRIGDLNRLDAAPESYDVVLAASVLHHVLDYEHLLDVVARALKPGGTLVCLDHMEASLAGHVLRYFWLTVLPTEVAYWRKPIHAFNRAMARVYRRRPRHATPAAFRLPARSPFEDISGSELVAAIRQRFAVERYETHLLFADVVAPHLRLSPRRNVAVARWLRRLDDWLVGRLGRRGQTYFLVARQSDR